MARALSRFQHQKTHLDGLIITPPLSESAELIRALDAEGPPFVRIAPNDQKHKSPYVDIDDEGAAREMTGYLIGLGHRRIAFIIGRPGHHASAERLRGYKTALKSHRCVCAGVRPTGRLPV